MEFNQDQIAAIIGQQQLEIIGLRMEVMRLRQKYEPPKQENVVPIKEPSDANQCPTNA